MNQQKELKELIGATIRVKSPLTGRLTMAKLLSLNGDGSMTIDIRGREMTSSTDIVRVKDDVTTERSKSLKKRMDLRAAKESVEESYIRNPIPKDFWNYGLNPITGHPPQSHSDGGVSWVAVSVAAQSTS
jgi:hypothetical protein